jgi:Mn2+/Fe2+ NRAMP family transporter
MVGEAPADLLVFAGAFNGILLPVGVGVMLWVAWRRRDLLHGYRYPAWLLAIGVLAWLLCLYLAYVSIEPAFAIFG